MQALAAPHGYRRGAWHGRSPQVDRRPLTTSKDSLESVDELKYLILLELGILLGQLDSLHLGSIALAAVTAVTAIDIRSVSARST
jgi:hypothetical protein